MDWNDLRTFLALHRTGRLSGAGRSLGVNETTVARRIKGLETALSQTLFARDAAGNFRLTEAGETVLPHAEEVEARISAMGEALDILSKRMTATVRITAVPIVMNQILIPRLAALRKSLPDIGIELIPDDRSLDLGGHEADLAIRFSRPTEGGLRYKSKKLASLPFAVYASATAKADARKSMGWIGYDTPRASLPQARWLDEQAPITARVSDASAALEAVANGLGKSLLPEAAAKADKRLKKVATGKTVLPSRDLWLLWRADQKDSKTLKAVRTWASDIFK